MVTVLRELGLRIVIFLDDQESAHVHVFGDGEAKVNLRSDPPRLIWAIGMSRSDIGKAVRIVAENRLQLLARWEEIHG